MGYNGVMLGDNFGEHCYRIVAVGFDGLQFRGDTCVDLMLDFITSSVGERDGSGGHRVHSGTSHTEPSTPARDLSDSQSASCLPGWPWRVLVGLCGMKNSLKTDRVCDGILGCTDGVKTV